MAQVFTVAQILQKSEMLDSDILRAKSPRFGSFWLLTLRLRVFAGNIAILLVAA
jgi:hypothetical protein